jgi:hypothetical protein
MTRKLDVLMAGAIGEAPPEGYEKVGDHWEMEVPELYEDGTYARSWSIHTWPPLFSSHVAAAWRAVEKITHPGFPKPEGQALSPGTMFGRWWDRANLWAYSSEEAAFEICVAILRALGIEESVIREAMT